MVPDNYKSHSRASGKKTKADKHKTLARRRAIFYTVLGVIILLPYAAFPFYKHWVERHNIDYDNAVIVVDKDAMELRIMGEYGEVFAKYGIACGKNHGNKQKKGDLRTPEGVFYISQVQDASSWKHDFNDGAGEITGAYGPYFFRLETPGHKGIGIHGTHDPASIGSRATEGCIRLENNDLIDFHSRVHVGMPVVILPSHADMKANVSD